MSNTFKRALIVGSLTAAGLNGCVMVPVASDGTPIYPGTATLYPAIPVPVPTVQGPGPNYLAPVPGRNGRTASTAPSYMPPGVELAAPTGTLDCPPHCRRVSTRPTKSRRKPGSCPEPSRT